MLSGGSEALSLQHATADRGLSNLVDFSRFALRTARLKHFFDRF